MIRVTDENINRSWARARAIFQKYADQVSDMRPVWKEFIKLYQTDLSPKIFASRGRAILGARWVPYSKRYLKWKQENAPGQPMMVLSGRLRKATEGGPGWFQSLEKDKMKMGVKVPPYWRAQQYGYKPNNLPPRPYFMSDEYSPRAYAYLIKMTKAELDRITKKNDK